MTNSVNQCIKIAQTAKLNRLKIQKQSVSFKTSELRLRWEPCLKGKIFQVILMPIAYPSLILFIIFDYYYTAAKLRWKIRALQRTPNLSVKNISFYKLWKLYGLDKTYPDLERLNVLEQWISILYPEQHKDFVIKKNELIAKTSENTETAQPSLIDEVNYLVKHLNLADFEQTHI